MHDELDEDECRALLSATEVGRVGSSSAASPSSSRRRSGWSVLVQGIGHDVTDALDGKSEHLQTIEVSPWAGGDRPRLLRIDARTITGRRFGRASTA